MIKFVKILLSCLAAVVLLYPLYSEASDCDKMVDVLTEGAVIAVTRDYDGVIVMDFYHSYIDFGVGLVTAHCSIDDQLEGDDINNIVGQEFRYLEQNIPWRTDLLVTNFNGLLFRPVALWHEVSTAEYVYSQLGGENVFLNNHQFLGVFSDGKLNVRYDIVDDILMLTISESSVTNIINTCTTDEFTYDEAQNLLSFSANCPGNWVLSDGYLGYPPEPASSNFVLFNNNGQQRVAHIMTRLHSLYHPRVY